jgi:hypothetical protein
MIAVVDVNPFKMNEAADKYHVCDEMRFTDLDAFLARKIDCDKIQTLDAQTSILGHYGGDYNLMRDAVRYFSGEGESVSVTKIDDSINGHLVVYAAETSRKEGRVVSIQDLKNK